MYEEGWWSPRCSVGWRGVQYIVYELVAVLGCGSIILYVVPNLEADCCHPACTERLNLVISVVRDNFSPPWVMNACSSLLRYNVFLIAQTSVANCTRKERG